MTNNISWQGTFEIYINGKLETVIYNKVMDNPLDQMINVLQGNTPDLEIKYLALGTSNTPITTTDTQLGAEFFRTPVTVQSNTSVGEVTTEFVVLDVEAVGTIEEIGIFGGSTASSSANSGTLISRILWHKVKTNSEEIDFKRIDRVVRG